MRNIDFLSLDGRSLRTFLVVLDEMSISRAAARLGVTQSAVSHLLDKLRVTLGDPLFVRTGRGISPTERAIALRAPVQAVLDDLKALTDERAFDPAHGRLEFTIAANDFQRDLIFPTLLREVRAEGLDARFRFIPAGIPATDLLRHARCQLIVTPFPPEGPDIYQARLFDDEVMCFFDADVRRAPASIEEFRAADYIEVRFENNESAPHVLSREGIELGDPRLTVPNFSALAVFMKGTDLISAQLRLMGRTHLQGLTAAPLPFATSTVTMFLVWHRRDHHDPAHRWLRKRIRATLATLL